jgi:hypothetical protein
MKERHIEIEEKDSHTSGTSEMVAIGAYIWSRSKGSTKMDFMDE